MALSRAAGAPGEAYRLVRGYPPWVSGHHARDTGGYLPVFVFHTLVPEDFEAKLSYLHENGYQTLSLDEAIEWMEGRAPVPDRSVVLTIDDGRLSAWSVGAPLLRRYCMVATLFPIPGYLEEGDPRPTLEAVWSEAAEVDQVVLTESEDRRTTLRWSEVEALQRSGLVAVESHTMLHRQVVTSRRLVGFLTPKALQEPIYEIPLAPTVRSGWTTGDLEQSMGVPIFQSTSILSLATALAVPVGVTEPCTRFVREEGGAAFFRRRGWRAQLTAVARRALRDHTLEPVQLEPHQEWELAASRRALEEHLSSGPVVHLCLPKGQGMAASGQLAARSGYRSVVWGFLPHVRTNRRGADPMRIGRLKHDYIFRLPGAGRRTIREVLRGKISRRLRGETGF